MSARVMEQKISKKWKYMINILGLKKTINMFAPYLGAGVRVEHLSEDRQTIQVKMKLKFYNINYVGTHFGGSLYSMCDPFYMFILMYTLGNDYVVWDKHASINFLRPGTGTVKATFNVSDQELNKIKHVVAEKRKVDWTFTTYITNENNENVAELTKILYIRKLRKL